MKKLTAGIFAGILTVVSVSAANAEIASKGYVDQRDGAIRTELTTAISTAKSEAISAAAEDATTKADAAQAAAANDATTKASQALTDAKAYTDTEVGKVNTTIGTVEAGKTVVQMINDAKTAATYDDAQVKADIAANADAIEQHKKDTTAAIDAAKTAADAAYAAKNTFEAYQTTNDAAVLANTNAIAAEKTAREGADATLQSNIDAINKNITDNLATKTQVAEDIATATADMATNVGVTTAITDATADLASKQSVVDAQAAAEAKVTELARGQVAANTQGVADNTAAISAANATLAKALLNPGNCANVGWKCALVLGQNGELAWEVIERGPTDAEYSAGTTAVSGTYTQPTTAPANPA